MKVRSLVLSAFLSLSAFCPAQENPSTPASKTVRLLAIGNSFSGNATHYLGDIANAAGDTLILHSASVGGAPLELHWSKVEAAEKDAGDKNGRYAGGNTLKEELTSEPWDFVTIQQASIKSSDIATYRPFAKKLADYIHTHAPGAKLLMHETWEYRVDDPGFSPTVTKDGMPWTQDAMYSGLASAYTTVARELGVRLIPVGDAFHAANRDAKFGFRPSSAPFDPKAARPGDLPDQSHSLNVGWGWKKLPDGKMALSMDGHHASTAGEYLGGCVWYEVLFGKSVEENGFVPKGLDPDYAKFLRATAHRAIAQRHDAD